MGYTEQRKKLMTGEAYRTTLKKQCDVFTRLPKVSKKEAIKSKEDLLNLS